MTSLDFSIVLPEVIVALYAMAALLFTVYAGKDTLTGAVTWATAGLFVALAMWIGMAGQGTNVAFGGLFVDDAFARFAKVFPDTFFVTERGLAKYHLAGIKICQAAREAIVDTPGQSGGHHGQ